MSGLIIPGQPSASEPELNYTLRDCEFLESATTIVADEVAAAGGPSDDMETEAGQLTFVHNDMIDRCEEFCRRGCTPALRLRAETAGLELPSVSEREEAFCSSIFTLIRMRLEERDGVIELDQRAKHVKGVVEHRLKLFLDEQSEELGYDMPVITDGAFQFLADNTNGNFHVILRILDYLQRASVVMQTEGLTEPNETHLVLPKDPKRITRADTEELLAHPKLAFWIDIVSTPKSQLFKHDETGD